MESITMVARLIRGSALLTSTLVLCAISGIVARAEDPPRLEAPSIESTNSESAIRATFQAYVDAFNRQDVSALGALWQPRGEFTNEKTGARTVGRESIEANFERLFDEQQDLTLIGRLESIRFIRPDVCDVRGIAVSRGANDEPPLQTTFNAVLVNEAGQWLFDSIDELPSPPAMSPDNPLQSMDVLVGDWVDQGDGPRVSTTARWSLNGSYLVRTYTIDEGDVEAVQGTQIVGWDPRQERIRCWMFQSDGSFGEGHWSPTDTGWTVKLQETLASGDKAGATQVIEVLDQDTLRIRIVGREVEGDALPSSGPVRVIRADANGGP